MFLPNADKAIISERKILEYLLSTTHPSGKSKAGFFFTIGFSLIDYFIVLEQLKSIPVNNPVKSFEENNYGIKYIIDGELQGKNSKRYNIRTVWIIEKNENYPKFVTAFPNK